MSLRELNIRPYRESDSDQLNLFRSEYFEADVEIPYGYVAQGVGTAVAEKNGAIVGALTATQAVIFDLIKNPQASPVDISAAVLMLERTMACIAQSNGVPAGYVAVPSHLADYIKYVRSCGYVVTCENCTILRRSFVPEVIPLLGDIRDAATEQITVE